MWRQAGRNLLCRASYSSSSKLILLLQPNSSTLLIRDFFSAQASSLSSSTASLSIWRRKKEIGKEGLMVAKELKSLRTNPILFERFMKSDVFRLLKSDLVAVLAEFQRQDLVFLPVKLYEVVRKEIWYRPDMFFYRDMLMMLARNKRVDEAKRYGMTSRGNKCFLISIPLVTSLGPS